MKHNSHDLKSHSITPTKSKLAGDKPETVFYVVLLVARASIGDRMPDFLKCKFRGGLVLVIFYFHISQSNTLNPTQQLKSDFQGDTELPNSYCPRSAMFNLLTSLNHFDILRKRITITNDMR